MKLAMVSFHQVLAERPRGEVPTTELEVSSKKRKWEEPLITEQFFKDHSTIIESSNPHKRKSFFDIELHLETPFPSNKLQQYLSIQSGIHLCNTRVNMKTPEPEPEPASCGQMSLDLELNLKSCESLRKKEEYSCDINEKKSTSNSGSPAMSLLCEHDLLVKESSNNNNNNKKDSSLSSRGLITTRSPPWLSIDQAGGDDDKEMVATVCMRCHMLVMLCKSSPSCPNCKFMHPPDQSPSFLMKRRCSLLC